MDEPFAALDVQTRAPMQDFLLDCGATRGRRCCSSPTTSTRRCRWPTASWCFTSRPGRIKTIVPIDLPRPRNLFSREAEALRIITELCATRSIGPSPSKSWPLRTRGSSEPHMKGRRHMASSLIRSKRHVPKHARPHRWNEITDGAVLQEDGTIVEIGTYPELSRKHPNVPVVGSGNEVMLPGFVNGHHHVGLTPGAARLAGHAARAVVRHAHGDAERRSSTSIRSIRRSR